MGMGRLSQCWSVTQYNKLETAKIFLQYIKRCEINGNAKFPKVKNQIIIWRKVIFCKYGWENESCASHPLDRLTWLFWYNNLVEICVLAILNIRITVRPQSERHYFQLNLSVYEYSTFVTGKSKRTINPACIECHDVNAVLHMTSFFLVASL